MKFSLETHCLVHFEHDENSKTSNHIETKLALDCSKNLDVSQYLDDEKIFTKDGCKAITTTLICGLVGNIHFAEQYGYFNSAEHLRHIIAELERGFAEVATIEKSVY